MCTVTFRFSDRSHIQLLLYLPVYLLIIKRISNYGNTCYCSAQNLSKNIKIRIWKTKIVCVWFCMEVQRRTFGLRRDEMTGGWRKLLNEELHNLYSLSSISKIIK
jgi:hypothetical protein